MFNARHHQAHESTFAPRPAGDLGRSGNVRRLRPNTVRLNCRPVAPRLVEGDGFAPESGTPPPPFDGILQLLELLERGEVPPHQRS